MILNDHEQRGLETQLQRRYGPRLGWDVRERTPERVAVAIWLEEAADTAA